MLDKFRVNAKDKTYQFWERNSLAIELRTAKVFIQKLEYIHWNPVKAGICSLPEEYYFSSALITGQVWMILICLHIAEIILFHRFECWSIRPTLAFGDLRSIEWEIRDTNKGKETQIFILIKCIGLGR